MPLTPQELAAADAARITTVVTEVVEDLIPLPGGTVSASSAAAGAGISDKFSREDHAHGAPNLSVGGDLTGTLGNAEVASIQSLPVTLTTHAEGDVLTIENDQIVARSLPASPAIPQPSSTVAHPTSFGAPSSAGTASTYSRGDHAHGTPSLPTLTGDVVGSIGSNAIVSLQGAPLVAHSPVEGQTLRYVAGAWVLHDWPSNVLPPAPPPPPPAPPPPAPPPPAPPPAPSGDIVDLAGNVDQAAYAAMIDAWNQPAGIKYRFGVPSARTDIPELAGPRADLGVIDYSSSQHIFYQLGGPPTGSSNPGNYVSTHGAAVGVPVTGGAISDSVAWFMESQTDRQTYAQRPQLPWQNQRRLPPVMDDYFASGFLSASDPADLPAFEIRGAGIADRGGTRISIACTRGSATRPARGYTIQTATAGFPGGTFVFKDGFAPTAGSYTLGGEVLLVTGWNRGTAKGEVAVVLLGSSPPNVSWTAPGDFYEWWKQWLPGAPIWGSQGFVGKGGPGPFPFATHPGLKNQGNFTFLKVVGYVELPDMKAPTSIRVTTGMDPFDTVYEVDPANPNNLAVSSVQRQASPLGDNLVKFQPGGVYHHFYPKGACAIVASLSEKKVSFIDLGPLFSFVNGKYFGSAATYAETQNLGMGPTQWPYLLADHPEAMPVVVKTVSTSGHPVAVMSTTTYSHASRNSTRREPGTPGYPMADPHYPRAWVATREGTLHIFSLGRYVPGGELLDQPAAPAEIAELGTVTGLGANVTALAEVCGYEYNPGVPFHEQDALPGGLDDMVFALDRDGKAVHWISFVYGSGASGSVIRTLSDSRMDPVHFHQLDEYSTQKRGLIIASYSNASIMGYRFGNYIHNEPTFCAGPGGCPPLTPAGEYAGALELPFHPTSVHGSNAP